MKISSFYTTDISESLNFIDDLSNRLNQSLNGKGFTPNHIAKFIQILRQCFTQYFSDKYGTKVFFKIHLPKNNDSLIEKKILENQSFIQIHLSYDIIKAFLNGDINDIEDYLLELIEQVNSVLKHYDHHFNDFLVIQMNNLSELCCNELQVYSKSLLLHNLLNPLFWLKFAKQSSIFNDYYNFYQEDTIKHKMVYFKFLKSLLKRCETL